MSVTQIVQHKHCINCGRAQPADLRYCSPQCETEFTDLQNRKKKVLYANYIMIGFLVLMLIFVI
jgi:predicted nucleic acid-binding Zn ribbon protein